MQTAPSCRGRRVLGVLAVLAHVTIVFAALPYDFTIRPAASGLAVNLALTLNTAGTLSGDYSADNPTGTRTKPGIFGSFGSTENVPVPVTLAAGVGGPVDTAPAGTFALQIDPAAGSASVSGFSANLLAGGPIILPATITLEFSSFRTRSPDSTFIGGFPLTLPIGSIAVTTLSLQQIGTGAPGLLTATSPGHYDLVVAPLVELTLTLSLLGTEFSPPPIPIPFPLGGTLALDGDLATLSSLQPLAFTNTQNPDVDLPEFPLDLPTILPPGGTAHLLMTLTLDEIVAQLVGTSTLVADGVLIPEPATGLLLLWATTLLRRR